MKTKKKENHKSYMKKGFTLIELLVVLFITAIVFAVGTANFRDFQRTKEIDGIVEQLKADLNFLREASLAGINECPYATPSDPDSPKYSVRYYRWHLMTGPNAPGYVLRLICDPSGGPSLKSVELPDEYTITSDGIGPEGSILFLPLGQGLQNSNPSGYVTITITAPDGTVRNVLVGVTGTIE